MRKIVVFFMILCCLADCYTVAYADDVYGAPSTSKIENPIEWSEETYTIILPSTCSVLSSTSRKTVARSCNYKYLNQTIAVVTLRVTFEYNGSTVSVVSKSVSKDVSSGWVYSQSSLTSTGGTARVKGKINRSSDRKEVPVDISLSCDINGNIT